jgi:hypothetical protein
LIKGTIFEQSVAFNLASATQESLIQDAKEVFVRASTKSKQSKLRGLADVSQLDGNRLRNLGPFFLGVRKQIKLKLLTKIAPPEILMRSDELKQLTVDELVDGLLTADDRIFGKLSVLERLARREMKTGVMVLIPTKAEEAYVRELFDEMQRNNQDAHEILRKSSRNAELFLLRAGSSEGYRCSPYIHCFICCRSHKRFQIWRTGSLLPTRASSLQSNVKISKTERVGLRKHVVPLEGLKSCQSCFEFDKEGFCGTVSFFLTTIDSSSVGHFCSHDTPSSKRLNCWIPTFNVLGKGGPHIRFPTDWRS